MFSATLMLPASPPNVMTDPDTHAGASLTQQISNQPLSGLRPVISYGLPISAVPTTGYTVPGPDRRFTALLATTLGAAGVGVAVGGDVLVGVAVAVGLDVAMGALVGVSVFSAGTVGSVGVLAACADIGVAGAGSAARDGVPWTSVGAEAVSVASTALATRSGSGEGPAQPATMRPKRKTQAMKCFIWLLLDRNQTVRNSGPVQPTRCTRTLARHGTCSWR